MRDIMRFLHTADLHLGRKMNGFSLLEDQKEILQLLLDYCKEYSVDAMMLAGDVYDKKVPTEEAVELLDWFVTELVKQHITVLMSSGNHDSVTRLGFGNKLFKENNVYVSYPYKDGSCTKAVLEDEYGVVNVYLLPFLKPLYVRSAFDDYSIESYTDALEKAIDHLNINKDERNVLLSHQYVGIVDRCDEELENIGGIDQVDSSVYKDFDYVALGHIHRAQKVTNENIRYSGSIYPYSFMKNTGIKTCTFVELKEKGEFHYEQLPLRGKRTLRIETGLFKDIIAKEDDRTDDYMSIVLNDEMDIPDAFVRLRAKYPNIMELRYDNARTQKDATIDVQVAKEKDPYTYCMEFYETMNNKEMSELQQSVVSELVEKLKEERE